MVTAVRTVAALALLLVILAGLAARVVDLPTYAPDSGDEWGNTFIPLRMLYERGDPGGYLHPSLYYDVTAAAYAGAYGLARALGRIGAEQSLADLLVRDERWFVLAARAVSLLGAVLAMAALCALGRRLWNGLSGLAAAALLSVLPLHAMYSQTVRVDSLFLAVFLFALLAIVRALDDPRRAAADTAAVLTGLAIGANYNGAILVPWLLAALWWRPAATRGRDLWRAALLIDAAVLVACPFVLLNASAFIKHVRFIASLSTTVNPGMEGRGALFYVTDLAAAAPLLAAAIAAAGLVTAVVGNRGERFVLSLAVAYLAAFSLMQTKFDRFILPAMALLLLVVAGVPSILGRRLVAHRWARAGTVALASGVIVACLVTLAPRAIPVPRHEMLARPDPFLFDWIGDHVPPHSSILVESGIVPLLDAQSDPGPLASALRKSLVRARPGLDQQFLRAGFVGGVINYGPGVLADRGIDFVVVSRRNLQYIPRQCDTFPEVCAVYQQLQERGRVVYTTPEGVEPAIIYDVR
ncbi:MAG TPA: glycosyltransferase family 39 protein [Candidatus Dormibacteraeota bacterium]|nr:glycosyltransferase family 39 protein [Candidatus Dormibacteraeota bacterium]